MITTIRGAPAPSHGRQRELGEFVRAQREKLTPAALGLLVAGRRRTPGLRREEVAQLCGLSVTWYTWLEQGREMALSPAALDRLAKALRLGRAERAYLFVLARKRDPSASDGESDAIPPGLLACLTTIGSPAYVLDLGWTARGWNAKAARLFAGWLDGEHDRNLLRYIFLSPAARALIRDHAERARRVVAEFRADVSAHLTDPAIRDFVDDLRRRSPEFARLWEEHGVLGREGGERTFDHPRDGFQRFTQVTLNLATQPELKLTILVPAPAAVEAVADAHRAAPRKRPKGKLSV
jgi:transcriptional regulator with XRE-family HTH domain